MEENNLGLTALYNLENSPDSSDDGILEIRQLLSSTDWLVAKSYGWDDLLLNHGFRSVSYLAKSDNIRFTICEKAELEILGRLEALNKQRHEAS